MSRTSARFRSKTPPPSGGVHPAPLSLTRRDWWCLGILGGIAGALRFYRLTEKPLWFDEIGQVLVAQKGLIDMLRGVAGHLSPPLDYAVLHYVIALFGSEEWVVRAPAALFGVLLVLSLYLLTRSLFDREIAFVSSILVSVSDFHIYYSQEVRMYSLFALLTVLSIFFFFHFLKRGGTTYFLLWVFSTICLTYTHYFGLLVLPVQFLYLMAPRAQRGQSVDPWRSVSAAKWCASGFLIISLTFVPWTPVVLKQAGAKWINGPYGLEANWAFLSETFRPFFWLSDFDTSHTIVLLPILGIILLGILFFGRQKEHRSTLYLLLLWALVPLGISFVATILYRSNATPRNFIFLLPAYMVLLTLGIVALRRMVALRFKRNGGLAYGLFLLPASLLVLPALVTYYQAPTKVNDWRETAAYLEQHVHSLDAIAFLGDTSHFDHIQYYYNGDKEIILESHLRRESVEEYIGSINKCTWIFVPEYGYTKFGKEEMEDVSRVLHENLSVVKNVYDDNEKDISGLYHTKECARVDH